jgi:hypothetical protein
VTAVLECSIDQRAVWLANALWIYGSDWINELSDFRVTALNMSIRLEISASVAAVESILRTSAATGLDTEGQINLLKVASRWLEATTVLCRYATSVHADTHAEVTFPVERG